MDAIGLNSLIWRAREDKVSLSQLVVGAWRAQVHWVDWAWRSFAIRVLQFYSLMGRFTVWRVAERFFAEFFGFLFNNISRCYFVFASLFPYSCTLLLLFVVHVYALVVSVHYTQLLLFLNFD